MPKQRNPLQVLKEAKQIAVDHAMFVVEKSGKYLLYRKNPARAIYLGARGSLNGIHALVMRCASH